MGKSVSLAGTAMNPDDLAYPCGEIPKYYPQSTITVQNLDSQQYININYDGLSLSTYSFENGDTSKQWADV